MRDFIGMTIVLDLWGKESDEALSALAVLILSSVSEYGRRVFNQNRLRLPWRKKKTIFGRDKDVCGKSFFTTGRSLWKNSANLRACAAEILSMKPNEKTKSLRKE